jgi:hypothetical protein
VNGLDALEDLAAMKVGFVAEDVANTAVFATIAS